MGFQGGIVTPTSLIVNIDNQVCHIQSDHPRWYKLKEAYKEGDVDKFKEILSTCETIENYIQSRKNTGVELVDGEILYNGEPVHNSVVDTIQRMMEDGFDIDPMIQFLENMMKNPSYNSIKEMWKFIEAMGLVITEDGCFLAYKTVRSDYTDKYTGRIDNTPGKNPPRLDRSKVDDNPNHHCSHGYHVGALAYAGPGGWYNSPSDKVIICKVNPADVVSVPNDHSCQKMRCCYYEPVGEFRGKLKGSVYSGSVGDNYDSYTSPSSRFQPECVDELDLLEDNYYIARYTKPDGTSNLRFFLVESYDNNTDTYTVLLVDPELNSGDFRSFRLERLSEVRTWDGRTDPHSLPNPWDDDEDEHEEYDYPNYW